RYDRARGRRHRNPKSSRLRHQSTVEGRVRPVADQNRQDPFQPGSPQTGDVLARPDRRPAGGGFLQRDFAEVSLTGTNFNSFACTANGGRRHRKGGRRRLRLKGGRSCAEGPPLLSAAATENEESPESTAYREPTVL